MELIKGRWYKNTKWFSIAAKFTNRTSNSYYFNEYINESGLHKLSNFSNSANNEYLEVPLSEIQQYLPDGHLDKEFVLKTKEMEEKPIYVKVVDFGKEYSTHSDARDYGMINYFYWTSNSPRLNPETKYKVVKSVLVNNSDESYILLDESTGYEYLIQIKGCKIIDNMEEKEIIGYKLKDNKYTKNVKALLDAPEFDFQEFEVNRFKFTIALKELRTAGVLDLWFEPVFKEEFKIGDWVMETWASSPYYNLKAFRIIRINDEIATYDRQGNCDSKISNLRLATPEEIKKTLVEEAIRRGFTKGIKFKFKEQSYGKSVIEAEVRSLEAEHYKNNGIGWRVISTSGGVVYSDKHGWAEILPNYPQIEINGYKGEFYNTYIKFGCAQIHYQDFVEINNSIKVFGEGTITNKGIESVTIGKGTFSKEQIKLISDYYLNKK